MTFLFSDALVYAIRYTRSRMEKDMAVISSSTMFVSTSALTAEIALLTTSMLLGSFFNALYLARMSLIVLVFLSFTTSSSWTISSSMLGGPSVTSIMMPFSMPFSLRIYVHRVDRGLLQP